MVTENVSKRFFVKLDSARRQGRLSGTQQDMLRREMRFAVMEGDPRKVRMVWAIGSLTESRGIKYHDQGFAAVFGKGQVTREEIA